MSDDKGWWSRHLGGQAPRPQQQYPPQQQVPQYPQSPQGYPQQQIPAFQPQQPDPRSIKVTAQNFMEVAPYWQGGEGTRTERYRCPKCGGDHFFTRGGMRRGPAPAPLCADCGYNGLFDQGDPGVWQNGAT